MWQFPCHYFSNSWTVRESKDDSHSTNLAKAGMVPRADPPISVTTSSPSLIPDLLMQESGKLKPPSLSHLILRAWLLDSSWTSKSTTHLKFAIYCWIVGRNTCLQKWKFFPLPMHPESTVSFRVLFDSRSQLPDEFENLRHVQVLSGSTLNSFLLSWG